MIQQALQQNSSSMAQNASGTLSSYMSQNGISSRDPDPLYQFLQQPLSV
ncbi:hypothetical protein [Paraburkholderia haematera]|uniref:Uncharacterized protein n=1 Tax=Paraburkholderia haematera TaxID=2793077 RepID=A0ABN7L5G1_9BURK|nr:hypothetical protein [Paraburkholderia haematera]CAE6731940.1 hypothetical protein R69888_02103 [Paraburkholderia haematera]